MRTRSIEMASEAVRGASSVYRLRSTSYGNGPRCIV